jgi:hypothetical protein
MLVFVLANYFCKEAVLFIYGGPCPVISDVFEFRSKITCLFLEVFVIVSYGAAMNLCEGCCSYRFVGFCLNGFGS